MVSRAGLLVPLAFTGAWQVLVSTGVLRYDYLPAPVDVGESLVALTASGELAADLAHTLAIVVFAAALALALGGALGFAIGSLPPVRVHLMASVDFLRTIPAVALLPVALLQFGPGPGTELILATWAAQWPVLVNTAGAVATVPARLHDVARTLRLTRTKKLRTIVFPAVLPAWLAGARVAGMIALLVTVVAEMIMTPEGLGGGLIQSMQALDPARMWAYALTCGVVGAVLNATLRRAVRIGLPGSAVNLDQAGAT
ncbi:ABC transporter permease [Lentzea aerocolonigenes]|uniref:ABC transporter permease n=1 Tax=Lentzea aerocolonigenes TaxID=68170 RepID=UPI0005EC6FD0|nr:ABC transporter permease subunit [Lentzea aerocolonigenes]